jgi:hypothetical protein
MERRYRRAAFFQEFFGYTTYKVGFVAREGLLSAIGLLLPCAILWVLVKVLWPWTQRRPLAEGNPSVSHGDD